MVAQTARKQARAQAAEFDEPSDGILDLGDASESPRRDVLFRLDGQEYEVLTNPPASMMLAYFDRVRKQGANVAFSWLLEEMLGGDGYQAIMTSPKVSQSDFKAVGEAVMKILVGTQGETVPKSRTTGSRRTSG
jgi:hypothetical protein